MTRFRALAFAVALVGLFALGMLCSPLARATDYSYSVSNGATHVSTSLTCSAVAAEYATVVTAYAQANGYPTFSYGYHSGTCSPASVAGTVGNSFAFDLTQYVSGNPNGDISLTATIGSISGGGGGGSVDFATTLIEDQPISHVLVLVVSLMALFVGFRSGMA